MRRPSFHRSLALAGALAAIAVIAGLTGCVKKCTDPLICGGGGTAPNYRPLNSPGAVLYNLVLTYDQHNADAVEHYKDLIARDIYQFRYYDPQSSTPSTPQFWGYSEEITTATGLLTDTQVTRLELLFPLDDTTKAEPSSFVGDPPNTVKITINGINLQVQRGDILYQTNGSADFFIAPISGIYQIVRWEDNTAPPAGAPRLAGKGAGGSSRAEIARAVTMPDAQPGDALREAARRAALLARS